jgi:hypothetical protein
MSTTVGIGGGLWGLFNGLKEYRNSQEIRKQELEEQQRGLTLKRQEILFPLIKEFDERENIFYAKELIDSVHIKLEDNNGKLKTYTKKDLSNLLTRTEIDYTNPLDEDEIRIRTIIDSLLNFFGKLGYLMDNELITKKEINYFLYYIEKVIYDESIVTFAKNLDYELFAILLEKIGMIPNDLKPLVQKYNNRLK